MNDLWNRIDRQEAQVVQRFMLDQPVKLGELARELGIQVYRSPLPPTISGLIKPSPEDEHVYEIRLNKYEISERQRFTLAHEISHFLLHKQDIRAGVVDSVMYRSALTSRKEAEANRLAADIIMPADAVRRELAKLGGSANDAVASEMAGIFKVSLPAMKVRLGLT